MSWFDFLSKKKPDAATIQPYMTEEEIAFIGAELETLGAQRPLRIFEYGSGGSTVFFPRRLEAKGIRFHWLALEHDLVWARDVLALLNEASLRTVQLLVCEVPGYHPNVVNKRPKRVKLMAKGVRFDYSNYTDSPRRLGGGYDVVIVDGRDRKNCLNTGYELLNSGGVLFFHDAERDYYQCAFRNHPEGKHVTKRLWVVRKP